MKKKEITIELNKAGVDEASETVSGWLEEAGIKKRDIFRIRLSIEEILLEICSGVKENIRAEVSFYRHFGAQLLRVRFGGGRFDPGKPADNEAVKMATYEDMRCGAAVGYRGQKSKSLVYGFPLEAVQDFEKIYKHSIEWLIYEEKESSAF